jgi:hypothetical protein
MVWFSNGLFYSCTEPERKWRFNQFSNGNNKMAAKNGLVLGWPVPDETDHSKTRLVRFSNAYYISNKLLLSKHGQC